MVAADVALSTNRPWDEKTRELVERRLAGVQVLARTEGVETTTMVRPADERRAVTKMAEVRGVQPAFPAVRHRGAPGRPAVLAMRCWRATARSSGPSSWSQLESRVGDDILIGTGRFTVRGVIVSEPGRRVSGFSFAPRVLVDAADLETTGLLGFGSRVSRDIQLRLPERAIEPLVTHAARRPARAVRQRPVVPRHRGPRWAKTCRGRRTTSASSASSSSSSAGSACRA